mmetsp:Transcript_21201/g.26228  ORF Transcript_21201/g.26228 Transcript_21201/m.26228 type:complete len:121 (+) Transcript_21201:222-584(+)
MTQERMNALDEVGFVWKASKVDVALNEEIWRTRLDELKQFKAREGHCIVPDRYSKNPQLGFWVRTQRQSYKKLRQGKHSWLTPDRVRLLEETGFVWKLEKGRGSVSDKLLKMCFIEMTTM